MADNMRWHLELEGEVITKIQDAHKYDFPWTYGILIESPEFERFRPYFTDSDFWSDDDSMIEALCVEVYTKGGFTLRDIITGETYLNLRLNQREDTVWFRTG